MVGGLGGRGVAALETYEGGERKFILYGSRYEFGYSHTFHSFVLKCGNDCVVLF